MSSNTSFPRSRPRSTVQKRLAVALAAACVFVASALASTDAAAHIRLLDPPARYEIEGRDTGIKSCPCGLGGSNRTCDVGQDGSDPDRDAARASTFEAGSTITLEFDEYIGHAGRYRVAFDPDGADFQDFNDNILLDVPDPSGKDGNTEGSVWKLEVTLPDTPCENCTLQLIQAMHGDTENPVTDPADLSTYYTCVDLTLTAAVEPQPPQAGAGGMPAAVAGAGGMPAVGGMPAAGGAPAQGGAGGTPAAAGMGGQGGDSATSVPPRGGAAVVEPPVASPPPPHDMPAAAGAGAGGAQPAEVSSPGASQTPSSPAAVPPATETPSAEASASPTSAAVTQPASGSGDDDGDDDGGCHVSSAPVGRGGMLWAAALGVLALGAWRRRR